MTNVKRIFSMLLALVMVFGSMSVLGTVANATPAGYEHYDDALWETAQFETAPYTIKSYADLVNEYGSDWSDNGDQNPWMYLSSVFYELDFISNYDARKTCLDPNGDPWEGISVQWNVFVDDGAGTVSEWEDSVIYYNFVETDHHVEPGQPLYIQYHFKGNVVINGAQFMQIYSRHFFDLEPQYDVFDAVHFEDVDVNEDWANLGAPIGRVYKNDSYHYDATKDLANDGYLNYESTCAEDVIFGTRPAGLKAANPDYDKHIWWYHMEPDKATNTYRNKGDLFISTYPGVQMPNCRDYTNCGTHLDGNGDLAPGVAFARFSKWDTAYCTFDSANVYYHPSCISLNGDYYMGGHMLRVRTSSETLYKGTDDEVQYNPVPEGTLGYAGYDECFMRYNSNNPDFSWYAAQAPNIHTFSVNKYEQRTGQTGGLFYPCRPNVATPLPADRFDTADMNHVFVIGDAVPQTYTASFYGYDDPAFAGTPLGTLTGTSITMPGAYRSRPGYTFAGWTSDGGTTTITPGTQVTLTQNTNYMEVWQSAGYQVKFYETQGGTEYSDLATTASGNITLPAGKTRVGFRFDGWNDGTTTYQPNTTYNVTAATNFVAQWTQVYTATFVDGTTTIGTAQYAFGETIQFPTPAPQPGYSYTWTPTDTTMPAANTTFTTVWTLNQYTVQFNSQGGSAVSNATVNHGSTVSKPTNPTRTGYSFDDWYTEPQCQNVYNFNTPVTSGFTLYAGWSANNYDATFVIDYKGQETTHATVPTQFGQPIQYPAVPTETGYDFTPWSPAGASMDTEGKKITTIKTGKSYNVTFNDKDNAQLSSGPQTCGDILQTYTPVPQVPGATFTGWRGNDNSFVAVADIGTATVPAKHIVYTAEYSTNVFDLIYQVDGTEVYREQRAEGTTLSNLYQYDPPAGKTVSAWANIPTDNKMPGNDLTLTATTSWIDYTVTIYRFDGGDVMYQTTTAHLGEPIQFPSNPTRDGYTFANWDTTETTVTGNMTINGVWNKNQHTVTFNYYNGGTTSANYYYGDTVTFPAAADQAGYDTVWKYQNAPIDPETWTVPALANGTAITLTADYTPKTITITYNINFDGGSTEFTTRTGAYNTAVNVPDLPTEDGYNFSAWNPVITTFPTEDAIVTTDKTPITYTNTWYDLDGTTTITTNQTAYGAALNVPAAPSRPGYTSTKWVCINGDDLPTTQPLGDQSFKLKGMAAVVNYTVEFRQQNLDQQGYTVSGTATRQAETGSTVSITENDKIAPGFVYNAAASTPTAVVAGDGSTTLIVILDRDTFDITVVDGEGDPSTVSYLYGAQVLALVPNGKTGHTFNRWDWTRTSNGNPANAPTTMPAFDLTATAVYNINSYNLYSVIDGVQTVAATYQYGANITALGDASKTGHTFNGWFTQAEGGNAFDFTQTMPDHDLYAYAQFTIKQYTYTFWYNGQEFTDLRITQDYGTPVTSPTPTIPGQTFSGWNPPVPATMGASDMQFTALTSTTKRQLTFRTADGSWSIVRNVDVGTNLTTYSCPTAPAKLGHTFSEWTGLPAEMPDENITVTAAYTPNQYSATFIYYDQAPDQYTVINDITFGTQFQTPQNTYDRGAIFTFTGWKVVGTPDSTKVAEGANVTMNSEGVTYVGVWEQDTSALSVESVVRSTNLYTYGDADFTVTLQAGLRADVLFLQFGTKTYACDKAVFLDPNEPVGATPIKSITVNEDNKEVWVVGVIVGAGTGYQAWVDEDINKYEFAVTYDVKDDIVTPDEFISANLNNTSIVRGETVTWTIVTEQSVDWLYLDGRYSLANGTPKAYGAYYYAPNYVGAPDGATVRVVDANEQRTWTITNQLTYDTVAGDIYVDMAFTISYRVVGSDDWFVGKIEGVAYAPVIRVAKSAEGLMEEHEEYGKFALVSAVTDKPSYARYEIGYFTVVTTDDCTKVRITYYTADNKKKAATYQNTATTTSANVTDVTVGEDGLKTWTIKFKFSYLTDGENFTVEARGDAWGDPLEVPIGVA